MSLKKYNDKRNFKKTCEPKGLSKRKINKKKIFCVQFHKARRDHYDFRLEFEGVLLSWAVPKGLSYNPSDKRLAVKVEDHPIDYAMFEGVIPKGEYGGGSVLLWDVGYYKETENFKKGLKNGVLKFKLFGKRIKGGWSLIKIKDSDNWLLIKENDDFALSEDGTSKYLISVKTGRTSEEIVMKEDLANKRNPFDSANVELASLATQIPKSNDYLFEIKYDGYRVLIFIEQNKVRIKSRNNIDYTSKFLLFSKTLSNWSNSRAMVLDGEMVVFDEAGKSNFQKLQNALKNKSEQDISFMVFDILALDGKDLRTSPLIKRKEILKDVLINAPDPIIFCDYVIGNGDKCFDFAKNMNLEGIIAKRLDSLYVEGRSEYWLKIKCYNRQEFVIGGYSVSIKKSISSLLLGVFENGKFVFVGRVGTGIRDIDFNTLLVEFKKLKCKRTYFVNPPKAKANEKIYWLKPSLLAEVQYAEFTQDNLLRQPSFKGLRKDKLASNVMLEAESFNILANVKVTSPNKIIYKKENIKKLDVLNYYQNVANKMLPFLEKRLLSVVRCHNANHEGCFYKKHPTKEGEGIEIVTLTNADGKKTDYFYITNINGLIQQAQLGTLEFHIWGSRADRIDHPDIMVFDLDPDTNLNLDNIRKGVTDLKKLLDKLHLKSFLKTSGGKGYHVVVPFKPCGDWNVFHDFAKNMAIIMEQKWPDRYTSNIRKDSRKGKIFIDWVRNGKGATSVAPYSLRARDGACVSMPIFWSELYKIAPNEITLTKALERIKKRDPWAGFFEVEQELKN